LRRIAARNDPKDFLATGIPKARALALEMGGEPVDVETREAKWDIIKAEIER
jgi:hypothetical protein